MTEPELLAIIETLTGQPFKPKTWPRLYQLQGIAAALISQRFVLFYDMQLGKTLCALQWAETIKQAGYSQGTGLVIAHAPVALDVWEGQARQHSYLNVRVVRTNMDDFIRAVEDGVDLIVMTWSGLQEIFTEKHVLTKGPRKGQTILRPNEELLAIAASCFNLFIIDEIHKAKNPWGLWFELAEQISAQTVWRLGLTGTPLNRDPFGIWAQLKLIDGGQRLGYSFNFFREAFGHLVINYARGKVRELEFNPRLMPLLSQRVASCSLSYSRAEAGIHVKVVESLVELPMYGDQYEAYEDCINNVIRTLDGSIWSDEKEVSVNAFSRLRQISAGYLPFVDSKGERRVARFRSSAKLEWLSNFFEELDGKPSIIIFCEHVECGQIITELLARKKIRHGWVYGGSTPGADKKVIEEFQSGERQVFLANHRSGGTSITLNKADYTIFFELPVAPIDRKQAQARAMADRGDRPLFIMDLCCSPTEHRVLEFIKEGRNLEEALRTAKDKKKIFAELRARI